MMDTQALVVEEAPIMVDTRALMSEEVPIVERTLTLPITNIGTRAAELTTEAKDPLTMISIYTTLSTNTFASASVTAWGIIAMATSTTLMVEHARFGGCL